MKQVGAFTATSSASDGECCAYMYKLSPQRLLYQAVNAVPMCTNCHSNVFYTRRWMLCLNAQTVTPTSSVPDGECCAYMYKLSPQRLLYQTVSAVPICTNCHNQRLLYQMVSVVPICTNCHNQCLLYQTVSAVPICTNCHIQRPICTNCHNQHILYQTVSVVPICTNCHIQRPICTNCHIQRPICTNCHIQRPICTNCHNHWSTPSPIFLFTAFAFFFSVSDISEQALYPLLFAMVDGGGGGVGQ